MAGKKIIVAGIGTGIGKTVASAILCEALKADYWKPVQAGELEATDSMSVSKLISNPISKIHPEAYLLNLPISPHAAAAADNRQVAEDHLQLPTTDNHLVIELAGGLMVPLTPDYLTIDWVDKSGCQVMLVSQYYLGSINHTLLSWEALMSRGIDVVGIIFNGTKTQSTFDVILHRTGAKCLLELSEEKTIDAKIVSEYARRIEF